MNTSTVTIKGQVTLPIEIRKLLNVSHGDKVHFDFDKKHNNVIVKRMYPFKSFKELPAFGMWKDRKDIGDADAYVRKLREQEWDTRTRCTRRA